MYVTSGNDAEIRLTLEATVELVNALEDHDAGGEAPDVRSTLVEHTFSRATSAPAVALRRLEGRLRDLAPRVRTLPDAGADEHVEWLNAELSEIDVAPALVEHDGAPLHIHWTPASARFDDQVLADMLMALIQELSDNGTRRFGRCAATGCTHLFYDGTRNGSRRFCSDPALRQPHPTPADHRRRRRDR